MECLHEHSPLRMLHEEEINEIKNIVTIATGEWGGDSGERGVQELL